MKEYLKAIINKSCVDKNFVKNFSKLTAGTASAQIVSIITVPILTRLYGVEAYGIQAVYNSVVSMFCILATGRYETAILLPKDDKKSFSVCCLVVLLSLFMSICWCFGYMVLKDTMIKFFGYGEVFDWLQWLPFTVMAISLSVVVTHWLNRMRDYRVMAMTGMLISIINFSAGSIYAILYPGDNFGLYFNTFMGQLVVGIIGIFYCYKRKYFSKAWISFSMLLHVAKKYINVPKYMVGGNILNDLSTKLPVFLLQGIFGDLVVGYYAMSVKLLGMPLQLITSAVGNVFLRDAVDEWNNKGNCERSFKKTYYLLGVLGIIPSILIFIFSKDLFVIFLGENWYMAGVYCVYLIPMYFIKFIFSPLSNVLVIANKQNIFFYLQFCRLAVVYLFMQVGYRLFFTADAVVIFYGIGFSLYYAIVLLYCRKVAINVSESV